MHKEGIVRDRHVGLIDRPGHILGQNLAVIGRIGDARAAPVLGIDEIRSLEGLHLIVFHLCIAGEKRIQLVALRMGDHEIHVSGIHPFREGIRHRLGKGARMGSPAEDHLRAGLLLVLVDGDEVREGLARVHRSRLQGYDRLAAVLHELLEYGLGIIEIPVLQTCERAHAYDVAIAGHHRYGLPQMLGLVPVHNHAQLGLQLPAVLTYVEHYWVHTQVVGGLLAAEPRPERAVEENQHYGLVLAQMLPGERIGLHLPCLLESRGEISYILYVKE